MVYIKGGEGYTDYNFDEKDPLRFSEVVSGHNGMPLFDRTMTEIDADMDLTIRSEEAHSRSTARRKPKRYESRFVVEYLDELDDDYRLIAAKITNLALRQLLLSQTVYDKPRNA